jgi:hypothetical protein
MNPNLHSLLSAVLLLCIGCQESGSGVRKVAPSDGGGGGGATSSDGTQFVVTSTPEREIDILFMVDNSPSMDTKQAALAKNFPAMIQVLQALEGGLPDLHIGVISSDMGAGGGELGANCGIPLGNRGLLWGNDNSASALAGVTENYYNQFATVANLSNGCGLNQGARWIADIQNTAGAGRVKNYTGNLTDVFSCLATAVGTKSCGEEHQLQSIRMALNPQKGINEANIGFLRPKAKLAIVMVTDEDDCSAEGYSATDRTPNNDNLFNPNGLRSETASLRCAGRGHVCNGQAIPNYDSTKGYDGSKGPLSLNFADCAAKETKDPPDYHWLPLIPVQTFIDEVIAAKQGNRDSIFVSGIIGWPQNGDLTGVKYRIDTDPTYIPTSMTTLWDYIPICSIPTLKSADGNVYKAYGGLRLKKFIDGFDANGKTYSICNNDFTDAMTQIAQAIVQKSPVGCVNSPLPDSDPKLDGVQLNCQATDRIPCDRPGEGTCQVSGYEEASISQCTDSSGIPLNPNSPQPNTVPENRRPCWTFSYDTSQSGCGSSFQGQKISVLRPTGTAAPSGSLLAMTCRTQ